MLSPPKDRKKPGKVWKLLKPAYGLKDASRQWFFTTVEALTNLYNQMFYKEKILNPKALKRRLKKNKLKFKYPD